MPYPPRVSYTCLQPSAGGGAEVAIWGMGNAAWDFLAAPVSIEQIISNSWSAIVNTAIAAWDIIHGSTSSWSNSYEDEVVNAIKELEAYQTLVDELNKAQGKANLSSKEPGCAENDHHVIARNAVAAEKARKIWNGLGFEINDSRNRLMVPTKLHWFIHTTIYYECVNTLVGAAFELPFGQPAANVAVTVDVIKNLIQNAGAIGQ